MIAVFAMVVIQRWIHVEHDSVQFILMNVVFVMETIHLVQIEQVHLMVLPMKIYVEIATIIY